MSKSMNRTIEKAASGDTLAVSRLVDQLSDPVPDSQVAAFSAIRASQEPALWAGLLTLMAEGMWDEETPVPNLPPGSPEQRRLVLNIYALFAHDPAAMTMSVKEETLLSGLRHAHPAVRQIAAELLGVRRSSRAVEALIAVLQHDNLEVRRCAANALGQIGDPAAIGPLVGTLRSDDGLLRQAARRALVAFRQQAVASLTEALTDPDARVRWESAKALSAIADPAAASALVRALEDENGGIRWLAAEGLIALRGDGAVPLLQALVEHSESVWLRDGAHHVFRSLDEKGLGKAVAPVLAALEDVEPAMGVPKAAYAAIHKLTKAAG